MTTVPVGIPASPACGDFARAAKRALTDQTGAAAPSTLRPAAFNAALADFLALVDAGFLMPLTKAGFPLTKGERMDYVLAKALKDAGFVQEGRGSYVLPSEAHQELRCYVPILEELIEACGADIAMLVHEQNIRMWSARAKGRPDDFFGRSPAAAVARLWLARQENTANATKSGNFDQ